MTILLFANQAQTNLALPVTQTDTTITVASGTQAYFPNPGEGEGFKLTLSSAIDPTIVEIVLVTAVNSNVFTVVRAQEGTVARAWKIGDFAFNLMTADTGNAFAQLAGFDTGIYSPNFSNMATVTGQVQLAPTFPNSIANKAYVDAVAQGQKIKQPCECATLTNIDLEGLPVIDGFQTVIGSRVLVKNQDDPSQNGIYLASTTTWSRADDMSTWSEVPGASTIILDGDTYAATGWVAIAPTTGTIDVTPIEFVQTSGVGTYTAGTGLTLTGNVFSITPTGVAANTYGSASSVPVIIVNSQGQITNAVSTNISIAPSQINAAIPNSKLQNSSITVGSDTIALGGSFSTLHGVSISGSLNTLSNIANSSLTNSTITINGNTVALGGSTTITAVANYPLTIGTGLDGTSYNGSAAVTIKLSDVGSAGTYGSANTVPVFTTNAQGRVTNVTPTTIAIANTQVSGLGTLSTQNANNIAVTGGTIQGTTFILDSINQTPIGDVTPDTGRFSTFRADSTVTLANYTGYVFAHDGSQISASTTIPNTDITGLGTMSTQNANAVAITGGTIAGVSLTGGSINNTPIGSTTANSGKFTTLDASGAVKLENYTGYVYANATGDITSSTTIPTTNLSGTVSNAQLANSSVTYNGQTVSLGGSGTITAVNPNALTIGTGLSGGSYDGSTAVTIANTGVLSFNADATGLTPATATNGAVTLGGTLNVAHGGTGATDAATARSNLSAAVSGANNDITSLTNMSGGISSPTFLQYALIGGGNSAVGKTWWNSTGTLNIGMGGGNIVQQVGEELFIYGKATSAITNGQVIWHTGAVGLDGTITFAPVPLGNTNPSDIIGLATENIANGQFGRITRFGVVHNLDTTGAPYGETWNEGDNLYYNPAYVGGLTNVAPSAPNQKTVIGQVITVDDTLGSIQVNIIYGSALGQTDSNVQFSGLANNDVLQYKTSLGYWTNIPANSITAGSLANALTIGTGLTGTSYNGSSAVTIAIDSNVTTNTGVQTLINKTISGSDNTISNIGNSSLTHSSITIGTTNVALGGSVTTLVGTSISGSTNTLSNIPNAALTNSSVTIGSSPLPLGGTLASLTGVTISGTNNTISNIGNGSLVNSSVTIGSESLSLGGTLTTLIGTTISGSNNTISNIANSSLSNSSVTIGSDSLSLGGTLTTLNGVSISGSTNTLSSIPNSALVHNTITVGNQNLALGDTTLALTGLQSVTVTQDPSSGFQLATKQYVDNQITAGFNVHTAATAVATINLAATYAQGGTTNQLKSIASNVLTFQSAHGLSVNDQIVFASTGNGITAGVPYYVYSVVNTTDLTIAGSYNGAQITTLTNGTGLNNNSRANSGVGATLTHTTNGALVLGSYTAALNDRILVQNQTNAYENGIYTVTTVGNGSTPYVLTRASDGNKYIPNSTLGLNNGSYFLVTDGGTGGGAGNSYVITTSGNLILGTTNLALTQFSQTTAYSAGTGLTLTGFQFSITNTGVTAGSYGSASKSLSAVVNAQGQLTSLSEQNISIAPSQINATIPNSGLTNSSITIGSDTVSLGATLSTLTGVTISGTANTITNIGNSSLTNSSVTIGSTSLSLGGTLTTLTGVSISGTTNTLTSIANSSLVHSSITIGSTGVGLGDTISTLTGVTISGSDNTLSNIANSSLTNSSITINGNSVALGGSTTVTAASPYALTIGTGLSGTSYDGSFAVTIANTGVLSFSAGTTGFTPSTSSTGAITLGGILNVANGGTGVATLTGLAYGNGTSAFTAATAAEVVSVIGTTPVTNATNASNATNSTNASNVAVTEDTTTNTAIYPTLVDANTGNNGIKTTSTKLSFVPSTGVLSSTSFTGAGTGLTGTATSLSIGGSAPAGSLTGSTLAAGVTGSSLTSVGTITSGTWSASFGAVSGANLTDLTAGNLTGTIPSTVLGNSTVYIGTTAVALNRASANESLTGIADITFPGSTSGSVQLIPAAIAGTGTVITLPATTGTVVTTGDTGTVTNTMLAGNIANNKLANSTISGISLGSNLATLTFGTHLTGTSYNGSTGVTIATDATDANTSSTIVARDASGNFSAGTITATLSGSATSVANALTIGTGLSGTSYNGSSAVTITNTGVLSFSGGTTGLTPSSPTTGAVTLGGTLGTGYGGTGLTTYNANGAVYATSTSALTTGTLPVASGGTGITSTPSNGYLLIGNGTGYTSAALTQGTGITVTNGAGSITIANAGVTSFSGGSTGLTPSTGTTGAVSLGGTLATGYGGTGLTSFTSGGAVYASSTSALTTGTLPITAGGTGITAFGTGVQSALGQAVSGSGSIAMTTNAVFTTPNLGTPSAVSLTNATNVPVNQATGTLAVTNGGTGATTLTGVLKGNGTSAFTAATAGTDYVAPSTATTFTATQTFNGSSSTEAFKVLNIAETASVSASAPTSTTNFYVQTGAVQYLTSNTSTNWTLNFAFSSGTSLNTAMATGDSISVTLLVTNSTTAYYPTTFTIDGGAATVKWAGGTAPSAGNASSIDAYTFAIIKTGSATFTVLGSQTQFK